MTRLVCVEIFSRSAIIKIFANICMAVLNSFLYVHITLPPVYQYQTSVKKQTKINK